VKFKRKEKFLIKSKVSKLFILVLISLIILSKPLPSIEINLLNNDKLILILGQSLIINFSKLI